jgi:pyruvate,water dikinase
MRRPTLHALAPAAADAAAILRLGEPRAADPALTGGKAASLSRLAATRRVPPGFVVALAGATLDRDARAAVVAAYRALGERCGVADPPVAVRSSAVDEDGADASFAGQHDTFLNVSGADQLWWAIARCVASFGGDRALAYRRRAGLTDAPARTAVLVQWLVPADAAGVAFSANPVTGARAAAELAIALEHETGRPVDLEVAWAGPDLYLLQCRPITTLSTHRSTP